MALTIANNKQYIADFMLLRGGKLRLTDMAARYGEATRREYFKAYLALMEQQDATYDTAFSNRGAALNVAHEELMDSLEEVEDIAATPALLAASAVTEQRAKDRAYAEGRKARALAREHYGWEDMLERIADIYAQQPPIVAAPYVPQVGNGAKVTPILLLSDIHSGAIHDIKKMGGLGEYNDALFVQRIQRLTEGVLTKIKQLRATNTVNRLIICWGGDNIEGRNIFAGQTMESQTMDYQLFRGTEVLAQYLVAPLSSHFDTIKMYSVPGNHGRLGKKEEGLERVGDSLDEHWIKILKLRVAPYLTNIEWIKQEHDFALFQVYGYTYLLHHGDKNKGAAANPVVAAKARRRAMEVEVNRKIDVYLSGHFHTIGLAMDGYAYDITNGAVPGTGPFAAQCGFASPPVQTLITVTRDCPVDTHYPIQLATREECLTYRIEPDDEDAA